MAYSIISDDIHVRRIVFGERIQDNMFQQWRLKVNNTTRMRRKYVGIVLTSYLSLFGTGLWAATTSDTTSDTTTTTSTTTGLPLGTAAIDYVLSINPGKAVRAAADGTPIFQGKTFEQPVDEPDLWDNVKTIFLDGLAQAIANVTGIPISTTSSTTSQ
jgi:hypothetical protein